MKRTVIDFAGIALAFALLPSTALAFDSGSTGADGDFNPPVSVEVPLPPNGILNYRSVNIPFGVTVTFKRNATNTPVVILVQGDAIIAGTIDVSGKPGADVGPAGDGNRFDDGAPGVGGPGGFDGGAGGMTSEEFAGPGLGPGGGQPGKRGSLPGTAYGANAGQGGSGSYATEPPVYPIPGSGSSGKPYGNSMLIPLLGGSGGGGGGARGYRGSGGGGGGGALLLAVSGAMNVSGKILANGGAGGALGREPGSTADEAAGGQGSGGGIRIVATQFSSSGRIAASGGVHPYFGSKGGDGRIRLEAEVFGQLSLTTPEFSSGVPGPLFLAGQPALRFSTVAGIPVPASPTGFGDMTVPAATANPVTVALATSGVPVGSIVKVSAIPRFGAPISVDSPPTAGSLDSATTSVSLDIPPGHSVLSAQTTFTVVAAVGDALSRFAQGERVEKVTLTSTLGQGEKATLHTVAGRQFEVEPALLKLAALVQ